MVVALFITEKEDSGSISEALEKIKLFCPEWNPRHMMLDYSLAQCNAVETCFTYIHVSFCAFHRIKSWTEWLSKREHGCSEDKDTILAC